MSSRQEEKEQRKQERLERERAAAAAVKRNRLMLIIGGVVLALAIAGAVAFAISKAGKDDRPDDAKLKQAATAGGCTYQAFKSEGDTHVTDPLTIKNFKTNPPTSGNHNPEPAPDGMYSPGLEPAIQNWVHTLEHGRILLQYKPDSPPATVTALTTLFNEPVLESKPAYHMVLMQNNSEMPFAVAAVAWRHYMGCTTFTPKSIEALRTFRDAFVDKGPEFIP